MCTKTFHTIPMYQTTKNHDQWYGNQKTLILIVLLYKSALHLCSLAKKASTSNVTKETPLNSLSNAKKENY